MYSGERYTNRVARGNGVCAIASSPEEIERKRERKGEREERDRERKRERERGGASFNSYGRYTRCYYRRGEMPATRASQILLIDRAFMHTARLNAAAETSN